MSWIRNLVQTYDLCSDIVGIGENQATALAPIGHTLTQLNIVVHLQDDGAFLRAEIIDSDNKTLIFVPCTEDSESRSGTKAIRFSHPLFDHIKHLLTDNYLNNLKKWLLFIQDKNEYTQAYRYLNAVYKYMKNRTLLQDLTASLKKEPEADSLVAFTVNIKDYLENRLWRIRNISDAWIAYYLNESIASDNNKSVCYVTGNEGFYTEKHPKNINRLAGNAKLISRNDKRNFTYRGRFERSDQTVTVSYEASQKAHQALRWLISKSSCYRCGTQAIIAWAIDKEPDAHDFTKNSYRLYYSLKNTHKTDEEKVSRAEGKIYVDYAYELKKALRGYNTAERLKKHKRRVAILATDASTKGRLAVTYYQEFSEEEYEERIIKWHDHCKWYQPFEKGGYFIGAPSIERIVRAVLGMPREKNDESYEKIEKNLNEQIVHCIYDGQKLPLPIVNSAVNRASNPFAFEKDKGNPGEDRFWEWHKALSTACALVKKFYYDYRKEDYKVELETSRCERDYLYGRLLAVADRIESHAMYKKGRDTSNLGVTNALRYMSAFAQHPFRTWNFLFSQLLNPYIQQLDGAEWYLSLIGSIKAMFKPGDFESDAALDGRYLLGYFAQRQYFYEQKTKDAQGGLSNELDKQD